MATELRLKLIFESIKATCTHVQYQRQIQSVAPSSEVMEFPERHSLFQIWIFFNLVNSITHAEASLWSSQIEQLWQSGCSRDTVSRFQHSDYVSCLSSQGQLPLATGA